MHRFVARLKMEAALIINSPWPEGRDRVIGSITRMPTPRMRPVARGSAAERGVQILTEGFQRSLSPLR